MIVKTFMPALALCAVFAPASAAAGDAGLHHFSGYYRPNYIKPLVKCAPGTSGAMQTVDHEMPPFTPKAAAEFNYRLRMEQAGTPVIPPGTAQLPSVGLVGFLSPLLITTDKAHIFILFESGAVVVWRIDMDREHPKKLQPSRTGDSVGHWEGDTLVVDTIGLNSSGRLDLVGTPFSKNLHEVTRISKIEGGKKLQFLETFDDPENFTKPFTARYTATWEPSARIMENEMDPLPPPPAAK